MATEFNFTKTAFNGKIFLEVLPQNLLNVLDYFSLSGTALVIKFSRDLTTPEETDLQTAVDAVNANAIQWEVIREEQQVAIEKWVWKAERHERQSERAVIPLSHTDEEYDEILDYMQEVREVDTQEDPFNITWPEVPTI